MWYVYEQITERIITFLAQGTAPWQKPWKARTGLPRNLVSQKPYRGINIFLFHADGVLALPRSRR